MIWPQLTLFGSEPALDYQYSPRRRSSWQVVWKNSRGELHLPEVFKFAPRYIEEDLEKWAVLAKQRATKDRRKQKRELENRLGKYLETPFLAPEKSALTHEWERLQKLSRKSGRGRVARLKTEGKHWDLQPIFDWINTSFFDSKLEAKLTWSPRLTGTSFHTIRKDGDGKPFHLLCISLGYDHPEVTKEILGGIIFHESLHIHIPPKVVDGRRSVHPPEFRKAEKTYPHYREWNNWHRTKMPYILAEKSRENKKPRRRSLFARIFNY